MQVFSRVWLLWGIVNLCPAAVTSRAVHLPLEQLLTGGSLLPGLSLYSLLYAWSITEVIRYLFYALKVVDFLCGSAFQHNTECLRSCIHRISIMNLFTGAGCRPILAHVAALHHLLLSLPPGGGL